MYRKYKTKRWFRFTHFIYEVSHHHILLGWVNFSLLQDHVLNVKRADSLQFNLVYSEDFVLFYFKNSYMPETIK